MWSILGSGRQTWSLTGLSALSFNLNKAATWKTGHQLRLMMAIILTQSSPGNPTQLWEQHIQDLSNDCKRKIICLNPHTEPTEQQIENYALMLLQKILGTMEKPLLSVGLPQVNEQLVLELQLPDKGLKKRTDIFEPE